jgi:outer membrane protein assembly factor BamB
MNSHSRNRILLLLAVFLLGGFNRLYALQGGVKWICPLPNQAAADGSPALDLSGKLFITAEDGFLYGIFPTNIPGNKIVSPNWSLDIQNNGGFFLSSPAIDSSGSIYVHTVQLDLNQFPHSSLFAVKTNGVVKWSTSLTSTLMTGEQVSTPAITDNGEIFVSSDESGLTALNAIGQILWSTPVFASDSSPVIGPDCQVYMWNSYPAPLLRTYNAVGTVTRQVSVPNIDDTYDFTFNPVPDSDGTIYMPSVDPNQPNNSALVAINAAGNRKWTFNVPDGTKLLASPIIGPSRILYFGSQGGHIYAINGGNGVLKWTFPANGSTLGSILSSPAISSDGTLYVTCTDGHLYAITASTGVLAWQFPQSGQAALGAIQSSPAIGTDGTVYFGSQDGNVYAITNGVSGNRLASATWPMFRNNARHTGSLGTSSCFNPLCGEALVNNPTINTIVGNHSLGGSNSGDGGPASSAGLTGPTGLSFMANGTMLIAGPYGSIREVIAGNIYTICTCVQPYMISPFAAAIDSNGYLYVADGDWGGVTEFQNWGDPPAVIGSGAALSLARDNSGNMFCVDEFNDQVTLRTPVTPQNPNGTDTVAASLPGVSSWFFPNGHSVVASATAVDNQGNIYVADVGDNQVWEFNFINGQFSAPVVIAGTGTAGYNGDNIAPTSANLNQPAGVALDAQGNLFIADSGNHIIRMIPNVSSGNPGNITTVAGIPGQAGYSGDGMIANQAKLNYPSGLLFDGAGNLYVADTGNDVVRQLSFCACAIIKAGPLVGNTFTINCLAAPGSTWTVYKSSDQVNWTSIGTVTMAADGTAQFVDSTIANVPSRYYKIANSGCTSDIISFSRPNITISTVVGNHSLGGANSGDNGPALSAGLTGPLGLSFTPTGTLLISGPFGGIREVTAGTITSICTCVQSHMISPFQAVIDGNGYLFVADGDWGGVTEFQNWNDPPAVIGSGAALSLARDSAGNMYCVDEFGNQVSQRTPATAQNPNGTDTIIATSLAVDSWFFPNSHSVISGSTAVDSQGNIYIADIGNNVVWKLVGGAGGSQVVVAGNFVAGYSGDGSSATSASLKQPAAVAVDAQGNIYIADAGNHAIRKVDIATGNISTIAGNGTPGYSGDGDLASAALLNFPGGLAFDSAGHLYIADTGNDVVRMLTFGN